ncbi:hypothetical protein D3C85_1715790 [compost metagenome]
MNWPMKKTLTAAMPSAIGRFLINLKTFPVPGLLCDFIAGRLIKSQILAATATGITHKKAPRHPI